MYKFIDSSGRELQLGSDTEVAESLANGVLDDNCMFFDTDDGRWKSVRESEGLAALARGTITQVEPEPVVEPHASQPGVVPAAETGRLPSPRANHPQQDKSTSDLFGGWAIGGYALIAFVFYSIAADGVVNNVDLAKIGGMCVAFCAWIGQQRLMGRPRWWINALVGTLATMLSAGILYVVSGGAASESLDAGIEWGAEAAVAVWLFAAGLQMVTKSGVRVVKYQVRK